MDTHTSRARNVIDFEASGLASSSFPIEVGVALADGSTYHSLIKPHEDWQYWDTLAQSIHGIPLSGLLMQGRPIKVVCTELNEICDGRTLFSDCWVHDHRWLVKLFAAAGIACRFRCSPIEAVISDSELRRWSRCKRFTGGALGIRPHRALNDALIIQQTLNSMDSRAPAQRPGARNAS